MARITVDLDDLPPLDAAALARIDALTDEQITAAALSDPDNPPWTDEECTRIADARRIQHIRATTGLTQAQFAATYRINVGRLRDLEQGRTRPDSAIMAYLTVIEREPASVQRALAAEAA